MWREAMHGARRSVHLRMGVSPSNKCKQGPSIHFNVECKTQGTAMGTSQGPARTIQQVPGGRRARSRK